MQFKFDGVLKDVEQDEVYEVRGMWVLRSQSRKGCAGPWTPGPLTHTLSHHDPQTLEAEVAVPSAGSSIAGGVSLCPFACGPTVPDVVAALAIAALHRPAPQMCFALDSTVSTAPSCVMGRCGMWQPLAGCKGRGGNSPSYGQIIN